MKTILLTFILGVVLNLNAQVTINWGAQPGQRNVTDSLGVVVPDGNEARIGYFDSVDVASLAATPAALATYWHELGRSTVRTIFATYPGCIADYCNTFTNSSDGQHLVFWIFKTSDNGPVLSDYSNVIEHGLFTGSSSSPDWTIPSQGALPPYNTVNVYSDFVDSAFWGTFTEAGTGHLLLAPVAAAPIPVPVTVPVVKKGKAAHKK